MTTTVDTDKYTFEWLTGELEVWQRKEPLKVSQFAEKHRRVTIGANQGKWSNAISPHLVRIMDAYNEPWVRKIVIKGVPQSGKTQAWINMHLYAIRYRGGNVKYVMLPNQDLARKIGKDRLIQIYRQCDVIAQKLSSNPDDVTPGRIAFIDGTVVYLVWGCSPAQLSSFPSDDVIADEVDKNADLAGDGKETDALKLLEKRTTTFRRPKTIICSSPADESSLVDREYEECSEKEDLYVVCPFCGELQQMKEDRITWPGQITLDGNRVDADPKDIVDRKLARYRCENEACTILWTDLDRDRAVAAGAWIPRNNVQRPGSIGFEITALICPDISLSEYAAAIIKAATGDVAAQMDLDNAYRAKRYMPEKRARKEDYILRLRDDRPEGLVPSVPIAAISAVADMQKRGFWYKITAWGFGLEQESWTLKTGFVDSWEALRKLFFESQFQDVHGNTYIITMRGIDSGGGESKESDYSRTGEAYIFCYENPGIIPFKGARRMARHHNVTDIDRIPGTNKALPGGLKLYTINTTYYKDILAAKLNVPPTDPGAWHLHSGLTLDELKMATPDLDLRGARNWEDFARQMCAEYRDNGFWECPKGKDNHYWDCSSMELALVDIHQVKHWPKPEQQQVMQQQAQRRVRSQGVQ